MIAEIGHMVHFRPREGHDTPVGTCVPAIISEILPDQRGVILAIFVNPSVTFVESLRDEHAKLPGTWHEPERTGY